MIQVLGGLPQRRCRFMRGGGPNSSGRRLPPLCSQRRRPSAREVQAGSPAGSTSKGPSRSRRMDPKTALTVAIAHDPKDIERAIRQALSLTVDRSQIIKEVLAGYGIPVNGPVSVSAPAGSSTSDVPAALALLSKNGWKLSPPPDCRAPGPERPAGAQSGPCRLRVRLSGSPGRTSPPPGWNRAFR